MIVVIVCKVEKWNRFKNFTYIVFDSVTSEGVIIDPAWDAALIQRKLEEYEIQLRGILITHAHHDHINLVNTFADKEKPVYMGGDEIRFSNFRSNDLKVIEKEDNFLIGSLEIVPFFTPGHSPGSICYQIGNNLFTGDTLFIEGCGMCFGDESSPSKLYHSLQKLKQNVSPYTRIYPGHSYGKPPGAYMSEVLKNNIYLNFEEESQFITFRMRKGQKGLFSFK